MTKRGTTGAGEPQITGVPRVIEPSSSCTMGSNIRLGLNGIRPETSPATVHGSLVTNGAKLSHLETKSKLGGRLAFWTPAKAKPKDRLMSGRS